MRIAIASTDGETVNEHFGRATRFLIFDVSGAQQSLVTERQVEPLSTGDTEHPFDAARMATVWESVKDCERVYCTKIGERPRAELQKMGVAAVIYSDAISSIRE